MFFDNIQMTVKNVKQMFQRKNFWNWKLSSSMDSNVDTHSEVESKKTTKTFSANQSFLEMRNISKIGN